MLIRGPFTIKWGDNTIIGVEEVNVEHEIMSEDFETVAGQVYEVDGPHKGSVELTLLDTDIASLAALLPQHHVENGAQLSTGETVNNAQGAMDFVARQCDESIVYNNLDIISCGADASVIRLVNARSKFAGIEVTNKIRKVTVRFVGEPASDEASMQFFKQGTINVVS